MLFNKPVALALVIKQLQERKRNHAVDQQKLKEADKRLQEADGYFTFAGRR